MELIGYPGYAECSTAIGCALKFNVCSSECLSMLDDEIKNQCGEEAFHIYQVREEIPANSCFCQVY